MGPMTNQSNTDARFYLGEPGFTVVTYKIMDNSKAVASPTPQPNMSGNSGKLSE